MHRPGDSTYEMKRTFYSTTRMFACVQEQRSTIEIAFLFA